MAVHRAPRTPGTSRPPIRAGKTGDQPPMQAMKAGDSAIRKPPPAAAPTPQGAAGS